MKQKRLLHSRRKKKNKHWAAVIRTNATYFYYIFRLRDILFFYLPDVAHCQYRQHALIIINGVRGDPKRRYCTRPLSKYHPWQSWPWPLE
jgi:hypothetical protein